MMHGDEKSDPTIVAMKPANEACAQPGEEPVEPRVGAKGNASEHSMAPGPGPGTACHTGLDRVRQAAQEKKGERFTTLLHHIDVDTAAVGVRLAEA